MTEAGRRADLDTAVIGEATPEARLLDVPLRPLAPDMRVTARGPFGEIPARACIRRGIARLVIDGAVRDIARIVGMGFEVFAGGIDIRGTVREDRGDTDRPLQIGGAGVWPGDLLVADIDAVIVPPADAAKQRYGRARRAPRGKP